MSTSSAHTEPGGPAHVETHVVNGVEVELRKFSVGSMDNNVYLLTDTGTGEALLVDAAADAERILTEVGDRDVVALLTTHGHPDHWQALAEVAEATKATTLLHPDDAEMVPVTADVPALDGTRIDFGGAHVTLRHTPGHTPGSVCALLGRTVLLSGDTLFPGGPGNTFGDDEAFSRIMTSLREQLFTLDDDVIVHPGHGDSTTIGAERGSVDEWAVRGW